jgi:hypothetical protein
MKNAQNAALAAGFAARNVSAAAIAAGAGRCQRVRCLTGRLAA